MSSCAAPHTVDGKHVLYQMGYATRFEKWLRSHQYQLFQLVPGVDLAHAPYHVEVSFVGGSPWSQHTPTISFEDCITLQKST